MLPVNALYSSKKQSAVGRRYRTAIQPQQGSSGYIGNNVITVNIPTGGNTLLIPSESTLNFTLNATNSSGNTMNYLRWDSCGAHGIVQRLRVYHSSNLLQDIDNYNELSKILFDFTVPYDAVSGKHSVVTGTRSDAYALPATVTNDFPAAYAQASMPASVNRLAPVRYSNSGQLIASGIANGASITPKNYSINLISIIGSLSSKYIPLFALSNAPLRVEIQLVNSLNSACLCDQLSANSGAAVTWNLSNVEFVGEFLSLSDSAISTILQGSDSPLQWSVPQYSNYQYSSALANNATTTVAIPVSAKYSSLRSLFCAIRNTAQGVNTANYYPFSSHAFQLSSFFARIGSNVVPSKPLTTNEEIFIEDLKIFGSVGDQSYQPSIDVESFTLSAPVVGTNGQDDGSGASGASVGSGSYLFGLDLEVFGGSEKEAMFQGINTNNDDIFLVVNHSVTTGAIASVRYDTFACYDSVLVAENGNLNVKF